MPKMVVMLQPKERIPKWCYPLSSYWNIKSLCRDHSREKSFPPLPRQAPSHSHTGGCHCHSRHTQSHSAGLNRWNDSMSAIIHHLALPLSQKAVRLRLVRTHQRNSCRQRLWCGLVWSAQAQAVCALVWEAKGDFSFLTFVFSDTYI